MNQLAQKIVLATLQGYKWMLSPLFPPACRYVPTCSEYAMEAVDRHGALRGTLKAACRLLRCHPFAKGGYDPVVGAHEGNLGNGVCCAWHLPGTHSLTVRSKDAR